jgi:hypothetical protein
MKSPMQPGNYPIGNVHTCLYVLYLNDVEFEDCNMLSFHAPRACARHPSQVSTSPVLERVTILQLIVDSVLNACQRAFQSARATLLRQECEQECENGRIKDVVDKWCTVAHRKKLELHGLNRTVSKRKTIYVHSASCNSHKSPRRRI